MMFRIPPITKNLLIINLIAFLATVVLQLRGVDLSDIGGLHFFMANDFHFYQFITYLFLHANFMHILSNMFGLWMFGCVSPGLRRIRHRPVSSVTLPPERAASIQTP